MQFWLGAGLVLAGGLLCIPSLIALSANPIFDDQGNCYHCGDPSFQWLVAALVISLIMTGAGMILMWRSNVKFERQQMGSS